MENEARKARNEYYRKWRTANPEKVKRYLENYWLKKAKENFMKQEAKEDERTKVDNNGHNCKDS